MTIFLIVVILPSVAYLLGVFVGTRWYFKRDEMTIKKNKSVGFSTTFYEDTFFIEPKDVVESYKQSSNVAQFINKIK
jgi:hypothetical protein